VFLSFLMGELFMPFYTIALSFLLFFGSVAMAENSCPKLLDFEKRPLLGQTPIHLCEAYAGKVVLIVNTASKCGFTPQFAGLEALYKKYQAQGLVVLGFPSKDFAGQEFNDEKQIAEFCQLTYGVEFPMFEASKVAKRHAEPLYQALGSAANEYPAWNFHKYLLNRKGELIGSFPSMVGPDHPKLIQAIESAL
jgi:glutathione peroxidase